VSDPDPGPDRRAWMLFCIRQNDADSDRIRIRNTACVDVQRLRFVNSYQWSGSALDLMLIRIQHFRSMLLRRIRIRDQDFNDQKFQNLTAEKIDIFAYKNVSCCIPMKSKLQEKPSALKREHPALQNMTLLPFFLNFC
jgi:hypothetical protein